MTGLVDAMFEAALTVDVGQPVVDVVGTGGDQAGTFNISTTAAFVVAGAGAKVAKHGNRAASPRRRDRQICWKRSGFDLELSPEATVQMIEETGFGFFFAPRYHPAMRFAGPVRRQLGVRTVFNFLGPLCNPAGATRMSVGTSDPHMAALMIEVLRNRGADVGLRLLRRGRPRRAHHHRSVVHLSAAGRGDHSRRVDARGLRRAESEPR